MSMLKHIASPFNIRSFSRKKYTEVPKVMGEQYVNLFLSEATIP
jgi:hypothetical protein